MSVPTELVKRLCCVTVKSNGDSYDLDVKFDISKDFIYWFETR